MSLKVLVAGAGIGGLCSALALAKRGFKVQVYEKSQQVGEVGAGLQLSPNAMCVLRALGVAEPVTDLAFLPKAAVMRHYQTGKEYFSLALGDSAKQRYGEPYLHIHRADLHRVLAKACQDLAVQVNLGLGVTGYQQSAQSVQVQLDSAESVETDVLVGADGIRSAVQACMQGFAEEHIKPQFSGQVAWRGTIAAEQLPKGLIKGNANLWVGPGQHFVSYFVRGGQLINFVAVQERHQWQSETWHEAGDIHQLRDSFKGWHPEVTELLAATDACFLWGLFNRQPLKQWTDKNVVLVGDACHPMLPFLAQGAAMAIEDAYALASCLATQQDRAAALNTYQTLRSPRTNEIQRKANKNAGLYHMSSTIERGKLLALSSLSYLGLSDPLAYKQVDPIYAYNIVEQLR